MQPAALGRALGATPRAKALRLVDRLSTQRDPKAAQGSPRLRAKGYLILYNNIYICIIWYIMYLYMYMYIVAALVKERLDQGLDPWLMQTNIYIYIHIIWYIMYLYMYMYIVAALVKERLDQGLDPWLMQTNMALEKAEAQAR